ncbi:flagellar assembly protein FliH [Clostridium sp. JS66]|uniref:FliH/SctL family protein n=1 Tax=Clostridium sp. JS66 TaxID=3064705 RepID=UPI00298DEAF8|nr:flagellar assembly protein FliH [Clostridium sp. JS66]WPC41000.1 flagellar assembly protein FliH [Clostridium sp. JS66]
MQSSYRIIKNTSVDEEGLKKIVTEFETKEEVEQRNLAETNAKTFIDSYENLARTMLENARKQSEDLLSNAFIEAERLEKEAYEKGYNEGIKKGYDDGFNKSYEDGYKKNLEKAQAEGQLIKNNADNILRTCKEEKDIYLKEKEQEIRNLIVNCVEAVLKRETKEKTALNDVIFEALSTVKNTKTFIIKSNEIYCEELKNKVELWKEQLPFRGDIFIIPDKDVEIGKAIIERENGKIVVDVSIAMEKIKEIVLKDQ